LGSVRCAAACRASGGAGARCAVEGDIAEHARGDVPGRPERPRLSHQPERDRGGDDVADDGDQSDQPVDAIADIGSGQHEGDVEQLCDRLDPRDPLLARQIAKRVASEGAILPELGAKLAKALLERFRPDLLTVLIDDRPTPRGA
jgi:hypothetical protein